MVREMKVFSGLPVNNAKKEGRKCTSCGFKELREGEEFCSWQERRKI